MKSNTLSKKNKSGLPYLDDFILHLQTNNFSRETIYNYERDLSVFADFLERDLKIEFKSINKLAVDRYKAFLASRDRRTPEGASAKKSLSALSLNRMLSSIRRYIKYLIDMDYPAPLAPEAIKLTKTPRKHPRVAEFEALVRLIESPTLLEKNKVIGIRNRAMLETLFATGMRISELLSLNRNQLDKTGRIFIRGKGRKERFVYLTERAKKSIQQYLTTRADDTQALFTPFRGRMLQLLPLEYRQTTCK